MPIRWGAAVPGLLLRQPLQCHRQGTALHVGVLHGRHAQGEAGLLGARGAHVDAGSLGSCNNLELVRALTWADGR
jgi:hypothetical protein